MKACTSVSLRTSSVCFLLEQHSRSTHAVGVRFLDCVTRKGVPHVSAVAFLDSPPPPSTSLGNCGISRTARGKRSGAGGAGPGRVTQPAVGVAWPARQAWSASVQSHGRAFRTQALRPTRRLQEAQSRRPPGTAQRTWRCRWTPWTCVSRGRRPRKRKVSLAPMGPACQHPVRLGLGVGVAVRLAAAPEGGMCLSPQPPSKDALRA